MPATTLDRYEGGVAVGGGGTGRGGDGGSGVGPAPLRMYRLSWGVGSRGTCSGKLSAKRAIAGVCVRAAGQTDRCELSAVAAGGSGMRGQRPRTFIADGGANVHAVLDELPSIVHVGEL